MEWKKRAAEYAHLAERYLDENLSHGSSDLDEIYQAARYSVMAGGKRLRPAFLMEFYRICGGRAEDALPFACGLEMIHTYSLIHDDLPCMDNDDLRRGKPTNHKVFGEATALLAGDALLTRAFETMLNRKNLSQTIASENALAAASVIASCAGMEGMIGGQILDLQFEGRAPAAEEQARMVDLKTGKLLVAACLGGCRLAGAAEEQCEAARQYAEKIGMAFQIRDDMLDVMGDSALLGKNIGSDAAAGKSTFVSLYGLDRCKELTEELTKQALAALDVFEEKGFLRELAEQLAVREK